MPPVTPAEPGSGLVPAPCLSAAARDQIADITPARVLMQRAGTSYTTTDLLRSRAEHAMARDAVRSSLALNDPRLAHLVDRHALFEVETMATDRSEYLRRPDLGRRLTGAARTTIRRSCRRGVDLQIVIGDGLSSAAVLAQAPRLLDTLVVEATGQGLSVGRPFLVHQCRVGVLNDVGDELRPDVVVLLIGERPGLGTSDSLSAYLAWRPRSGHHDAQRNVLANVHRRGVPIDEAARRILSLAATMRERRLSGVDIKELDALPAAPRIERDARPGESVSDR